MFIILAPKNLVSGMVIRTFVTLNDNIQSFTGYCANMQRLQCELQDAIMRQIPDCGHLPHVQKPGSVAKLIVDFSRGGCS